MYTSSIIFYIFSGLIFIVILCVLTENQNYKKIYKRLAILFPVVASLSVVAYLIYFVVVIKDYKTVVDSAGMGIFALLASVWVGLNIYNVIEKKDIEDLFKKNDKIQKDNDEFKMKVQDLINYYESQYNELINDYQSFVSNSEINFKSMILKELFYESQMDFMNGLLYFNKARYSFDNCIVFLKKINDEKSISETISSFTNNALGSALDISDFVIGLEIKSEYNERDIQKLLDYVYAYEHVMEKPDYYIKRKSDEINQMLVYSLSNYMNIKQVIEKWVNYNKENDDKDIKHKVQILESIIKKVEKTREKHEIYLKSI